LLLVTSSATNSLYRVVAYASDQEVSEVSYRRYQDANCKVAMMYAKHGHGPSRVNYNPCPTWGTRVPPCRYPRSSTAVKNYCISLSGPLVLKAVESSMRRAPYRRPEMVSNTRLMRICSQAQRKSHHGFVLVAVTIVLGTYWAYYHGENATYPLASDTCRGRCSFPALMPTY
jgi:hypothetical protein